MKIYLIAILALISSTAFAKSSAHILSASSSANVALSQTAHEDYKARFNLGVGYDYAFNNGFQVGAVVATSLGSNYKDYTILAGPGYNFNSEDLENSFFVTIKGGVYISDFLGVDSTDALITAEVAKRFKLADNISYVPGVEASKVLSHNSQDPFFVFNIFKFSLLF